MTTDPPSVRGKCVLVLEDDYYLATDLKVALERAGATVIGPFGDAGEAQRAIIKGAPDGALVDVNLGLGPSFAVPRALLDRSVPFVFVTGYDADVIPQEYASAPRFEKPVDARRVDGAIAELLDT